MAAASSRREARSDLAIFPRLVGRVAEIKRGEYQHRHVKLAQEAEAGCV